MTEENYLYGTGKYVLSILGIIFAFIQPIIGILFCISCFLIERKENKLVAKSKRMAEIGIILNVAIIIITIALTTYLTNQGYLLSSTLA